MHSNSSRAIKILLLCMALMLSACSMVRVAYNNGESLTYWWLDGYIDIENDQRPWVKERIDRLFDWHRKTQLRDYTRLLRDGQKRLQTGIDKPTALADIAEMKKRLLVTLEAALPDLVDLALDLRPEQLVRINKKFASLNSEYRKDYLRGDLEDRHKYRFKKILSQAEFWFGDFSREQEAQIRKAVAAVPLDNDLYYRARLRRQRDLMTMLTKIQSERPSRDATIAMLRTHLVAAVEQPGGTEYGAFFNTYYDGMAGVVFMIVNSATPAQKQHAHMKLQEFINDFSQLGG